MKRPAAYWHHLALAEEVVDEIDTVAEDHETQLSRFARMASPEYPRETPEYLARMIGLWVTEREGFSDFASPIENGTDGEEGECMAQGYIGVRAFEMAEKQFE